MARLAEEQQAALRKFKEEALGVKAPAQPPKARTSREPDDDSDLLPATEVAQIVGCEVGDVLMILRQLGYTKKTSASRLTVGEAEGVREKWNASKSSPIRPTLRLVMVAAELDVDLPMLVLEAKRAGIPVRGDWDDFKLFKAEADHLRRVLTSQRKGSVQPVGPVIGSIRTTSMAIKQVPNQTSTTVPTPERPARTASEMTGWQIPAAANSLASKTRILPLKTTAALPVTGALAPPKPAAVIEIQRALVRRSKAVELDPEGKNIAGGVKMTSDIQPLTTVIGKGSPEVDALRQTLGEFAPKDHAVLFRELNAVLDIDEKISRSLPPGSSNPRHTDTALRSLMRLVCHGKFGLFAYHEVSNIVRSAARKKGQTSTPGAMANALTNLRPMNTGVLTDLGKSRFIFWHVKLDGTSLAIVTFSAVSDWLLGINRGLYVPLRGRLIAVDRRTALGVDDGENARYMAEAAIKLRKGAHVRRSSPTEEQPKARNYLDSRAPQTQRNLTYKPHNDWLIPVVVEDGFVTGGLREGFFSNYGGRAAHGVRGFVRRAPGSSVNDPKTIYVNAHMRGGYDVGDIAFMPTVTILRDK